MEIGEREQIYLKFHIRENIYFEATDKLNVVYLYIRSWDPKRNDSMPSVETSKQLQYK